MASIRGRSFGFALGLLALTLLALAMRLRERAPIAPAPRGAIVLPSASAPAAAVGAGTEADRSALEAPAPTPEPRPPALLGRVLDEAGLPLGDLEPRVDLRGPAGQRLSAALDDQGHFGPLLLSAGTWQVAAGAPGRCAQSRTLELADGDAPAELELRLPPAGTLDVHVVAVGPGTGGEPERDLESLAGLLTLHLTVDGESRVDRRPLSRTTQVRFEVAPGRAATLELRLGAERVLRRALSSDAGRFVLDVDPLELAARLVELELVLRDPRGEPLKGVLQVLLAWEGGAHRLARLSDQDPSRALLERCPPGPARLRVVDADGRAAEVEVALPDAGPALLELPLELRTPERR
jgi:hypothetical protein